MTDIKLMYFFLIIAFFGLSMISLIAYNIYLAIRKPSPKPTWKGYNIRYIDQAPPVRTVLRRKP